MLAIDDGWPRVLQACKRDGSKMRLDKDKESSRSKKGGLWFLDCICDRLCRIKSLQKVSRCCFDFHCDISYIMVGIVLLLVLGSIRD